METLVSALLVLFFGLMGAYDVFLETERATTSHLIIESSFVIVAFGWAIYLVRQLWEARGEMVRLEADARHWREESAKWAAGLSQSIDDQLTEWKLTPAEKDVALLLMKGFELKEIGHIRGTTERTARQQAATLYQKSNLAGRAELTAFFLEDLLVPSQASGITTRMSLRQ